MRTGYIWLGWLMLLAGICGAVYFMFSFDASVPSSLGSDRINNEGLLVQKLCGVIATCSTSIVGAVLVVAGQIQSEADRVWTSNT